MNQPLDPQSYSGNWQATTRLHDPTTGLPEDSASSLTIQRADPSVEGAPVTQIDYTWAYQGAPQKGTILLYAAAETSAIRADWTDTWHTGGENMPLTVKAGGETTLSLLGSYAAPPGPDWGWRIVLEPIGETLQLRMDNITPDGEDLIAVEATYRRS